MSAEDNLKRLSIALPEAPTPVANYVPCAQVGELVFLSGHGPLKGSPVFHGKVGVELTLEQGRQAARETGLNLLASLRKHLGNLDRVVRVVKVLGLVNALPDFGDHPKVINGFSDLMVEVFGDAGRHARSAVGAGSLPGGMSVEIEMIVQVKP